MPSRLNSIQFTTNKPGDRYKHLFMFSHHIVLEFYLRLRETIGTIKTASMKKLNIVICDNPSAHESRVKQGFGEYYTTERSVLDEAGKPSRKAMANVICQSLLYFSDGERLNTAAIESVFRSFDFSSPFVSRHWKVTVQNSSRSKLKLKLLTLIDGRKCRIVAEVRRPDEGKFFILLVETGPHYMQFCEYLGHFKWLSASQFALFDARGKQVCVCDTTRDPILWDTRLLN